MRFPLLLRKAWFSLNQAFRERLSHTGLTPAQFTALRWLWESSPESLSQRELADLTASNPNNVADLVERLERKGRIRRERDVNDSRRKVLSLTNQGLEAYAEARGEALSLQEEVLGAVPADEREKFLALLARINENLSREAEASAASS